MVVAVSTVPAGNLIDQVRRGASLEDLLAGRSPGERTNDHLIKMKRPRARALAMTEPRQRVLSLLRDRPGGPLEPFGDDAFPGGSLAPDPDVDDTTFAFDPPAGDIVPPGPGGGGSFVPVPPGPSLIFGPDPGPGPGPGPGPNPETPGNPVPPIPGAIPEPATWLMMILGLGLIGGALRRARSAVTRGALRALR